MERRDRDEAVPWFDGHNDVLLRLSAVEGDAAAAARFAEPGHGHLNLPAARRGLFVGGFFAVFCRSRETAAPGHYEPLAPEAARPVAERQMAIFDRLAEAGHLRPIRSACDLGAPRTDAPFPAVLHLEGAEALGPGAEWLGEAFARGLRSLGLVWSRENAFGTGVPIHADMSPDIGPGLTEAGRALVRRCDEMGIVIDLSHLNEKGFWDVAALSRRPLVATHSNAHALCPHARNLTDDQLRAVAGSGGVVGLTFAVDYLRPDGRRDTDTPLSCLADHFEHMLGILGPGGLAIGSDFDGAYVPDPLDRADRVPDLAACLRGRGHGADLLGQVFHGNWRRILSQSLPRG